MKKFSLNRYLIFSCAVIFSFITLILQPISVWTLSDITLSLTLLPDVINILLELAEILAFAACYSLVIYAAVTRCAKAAFSLCGIYIFATLLRRLAVLVITYLSYSFIDGTDIFNVSAYFILESAMILLVALVSCSIGKKYRCDLEQKKKAAQQLGDLSLVESIRFDKLFVRYNPILTSSLFAGVMLSLIKIAMRINHDVKYTEIYGAPSEIGEVIIMIVYYLSDILAGVIYYAISWLIYSALSQKDNH